MSQITGYARVSTNDQSLDVQLQQLKDAGCTKFYQEKVSGVKSDRPELTQMLKELRKGDTVVVTKLDRLGRSTRHLLEIVDQLQEGGIEFKALNSAIDTASTHGRLMLGILATIAEFERSMLRERQAEGIEAAKQRGVYTGRKPTARAKSAGVLALLKQGMTKQETADQLGIGVASVYRIAKAAAAE